MRITALDKYILKRFFATFLIALGLFTLIIIVFDISEKVDDFIGNKVPMKEILLSYYLNWIPFLLNLFGPIFVFISVIFFTSKMAAKSEIIAILSSGVSYLRMVRPYMYMAVLIAIFSFLLNGWIIPKADKNRVEFENTHIRDRNNDYKREIKTQVRPGIIMTLESYNYMDSFGYQLSLEKISENRLESKLVAEKLRWNKRTNSWMVENYSIRSFENGEETLVRGKQLDTMIQFEPEDFFRRQEDVQSFNFNELNRYIELEHMRGTGNAFFYITEYHRRFAAPFSILVLTFIGVCVSSRKERGGVGLSLGKGILISFLYLLVIQFFNAFGQSGTMNPLLAVWVPNVIFAGVGYWLYRVAQK